MACPRISYSWACHKRPLMKNRSAKIIVATDRESISQSDTFLHSRLLIIINFEMTDESAEEQRLRNETLLDPVRLWTPFFGNPDNGTRLVHRLKVTTAVTRVEIRTKVSDTRV